MDLQKEQFVESCVDFEVAIYSYSWFGDCHTRDSYLKRSQLHNQGELLSDCVSNHSSVVRINLAVLATTVETSSGDQCETKVFIITLPLRCVSVQLLCLGQCMLAYDKYQNI